MSELLTFAELTDEQRAAALVGVRRMAEKGSELTPDEFVETYAGVHLKVLGAMRRMGYEYTPEEYIALFAASRFLDEDGPLPPPPYRGLFDDENEANRFAERASKQHGVALVVQHNKRLNRWRVVEEIKCQGS